jgi:hypothetical protein
MSDCSLEHNIPFILSYVRYLKPIKLQTPLLSHAAYNITADNIKSVMCLSVLVAKIWQLPVCKHAASVHAKHLSINYKTN